MTAKAGWMDYLNNYYKYSLSHQITPRACCLYGHILYEHNRAWWPESIALKADYLAGICNMSRSGVYRAREELRGYRMIDYEERGANRPAVYRLISPRAWAGRLSEEELAAIDAALKPGRPDDVRRDLSTRLSTGRMTQSDYAAAMGRLQNGG